MEAMKTIRYLLVFSVVVGLLVAGSLAVAKGGGSYSQLKAFDGKSYAGLQDPEFINYDSALRSYMVQRINKRFGVSLDPKAYSGFELLEIEALFKCKKPGESFDSLLKMYSGRK